MSAHAFAIASFRSRTDTAPRASSPTWPELRNRLTRHEVRAPKDGPLWSPTLYREGATRGNAGVLSLSCFVADVDDGTPPAALLERWEGLAWCLHSTHSSTSERPKWRVVFPLARSVPASEWSSTWRRLTHHLMDGHNDAATKDPARIHYLPAAPPERFGEAFADGQDGAALDPAAFADPPEIEAADRLVAFQRRKPPADRIGAPAQAGADYNAHAQAVEVVGMLTGAGWRVERERGGAIYLTRPGKHSGVSGVVGWPTDPAPMFYCFTSSAPPFEAGKTYDAFGVHARLIHGGDFREAARDLAAQGFGRQAAIERMGGRR